MAPPDDLRPLALIGYGEVGRILAEDLRAGGAVVVAYDTKLAGVAGNPLRTHAAQHGTRLAVSHADAVRGCGLVVSAVTASQAVAVAAACGPALDDGAFFLDCNSASPAAKQQAADRVHAAGGRYVEGAVMTLVPPHRLRVPLLLGGPHAPALLPFLQRLGFAPAVADGALGIASASKMCRSVMVKGIEALLIESLTAARAYGVEDAVLASLQETWPGLDWQQQACHAFNRVAEHGRRRGEEMREVAETVAHVGLQPLLSAATAERDAWMAALADDGVFGLRGAAGFARAADWRTEADRILNHVNKTKKNADD